MLGLEVLLDEFDSARMEKQMGRSTLRTSSQVKRRQVDRCNLFDVERKGGGHLQLWGSSSEERHRQSSEGGSRSGTMVKTTVGYDLRHEEEGLQVGASLW